MQLRILFVPIIVVGMLQLAGCARVSKTATPPRPGGTYLSQSAGGFFQQSVKLAKEEGNISNLVLWGAHRPSRHAQEVYVAAGAAGLVYSSDGGSTWTIWTSPLAYLSDVVALDNGVVVASGTDKAGQGYVVRTIDRGKSWESVLTIPVPVDTGGFKIIGGNTAASQSIVIAIAPDPFHGDRVYAGTTLGNVLVGEQSAKTWRTLYTLSDGRFATSSMTSALGIREVVPSPHKDGEVLVITVKNKLYRVIDNEQTELSIAEDLNNTSPYNQGQNRGVLSASYVAGSPNALFVGVDDGAVLSKDGGKTWKLLDLPVDVANKFNTVVVVASPTNPARLFVGINSVVYRSEDGGQSWHSFSLELVTHAITSVLIDPTNAANVLLVTTPVKV